jgi:galactitol-specific phosphotransferase system IIB component
MKAIIISFLTIFLVISLQAQTDMQTQEEAREVIARGLGAILAGDEVKARDDAIAAALRNAVEQVVGTMVKSDVLVENYQTIEDKIYTSTSGYVQKYDIISQSKQLDNSLEVTIKAIVKVSDLRNDLEAIQVLIREKGKPRTMVLVDERNIGESYYHYSLDLNTTETVLMGEMTGFGFPFVDAKQAKENIARDVVNAALQGDDKAAASIAAGAGAEIIITGKAVCKVASGGPAVLRNAGMKSCHANLTLRVIRADDGVIIASTTAYDRAAHIDEISGGTQALEKAAKKAAVELKDKIVAAWQKDVYSSTQVQLRVQNISSFSQLNVFKNSLKYYVRGLQSVYQRSFGAGTALFDVDIKGTAAQMASELAAKEIEGLKLEVIDQTANKVTVRIIQPEE